MKKISGGSFRHPASPHKGFTLIELLVTLAILSIVLAIAVPNMRSAQALVLHQSREFGSVLNYARSEAVNRSQPITLCASSDPDNEAPVCGGNWEDGWIVLDASNQVLKRRQATDGKVTVATTGGRKKVLFSSRGFTDSGDPINFMFCSAKDKRAGRTIVLASSGRVMRWKGLVNCGT